MIVYTTFPTPFGWCGLVKGEQGLIRVYLPERERNALRRMIKLCFPLSVLGERFFGPEIKELTRYFKGDRPAFSCKLDFSGSTAFQRTVWTEAKKIPCGSVRTYGWIARRAGKPQAARAVGTALGRNPFPIIIPCHRVIRDNGGLGGFSATRGIDLKRELLILEGGMRKKSKK